MSDEREDALIQVEQAIENSILHLDGLRDNKEKLLL